MGKDYRLRKNYYFCRSQVEPSGGLILIKNRLEQIFRLVEMSFRNQLLLCVATVAVSCRNKLLMQNLIPVNIKTILSYFFRHYCNRKSLLHLSENIFFDESFIAASGNLFSV